MKNRSIFIVLFGIIPFNIYAQNTDTIKASTLVFNIPVVDLPYQLDAAKTVNENKITIKSFLKGYANPSMHQSLDLSTDLYTAAHFGIKKIFNINSKTDFTDGRNLGKYILYFLSLVGSDVVLVYTPGFNGWEHEEFHRAVMTRFQVNSFNDINNFPIGAGSANVSHVKDDDLIKFKKESPKDFIRMPAAGIEGEYMLIEKLQRNNFFYNQNLPHQVLYLLSTYHAIDYVRFCSQPKALNGVTDYFNSNEKTIKVRDFTGMDFSGWVYDLFKPNEPYAARGIHPSGIGIDRYIRASDLTSIELAYLKKQGDLQWLNAISPMLVGFKSIKLSKNELSGNFSIRNYLTSFGNDISCNIYLMNPNYKFIFVYHSYQNYNKSFPAIETQLIDFEKSIYNKSVYFSPRLILGMQPFNQDFKTKKSDFLGLVACKFEIKMNSFIHPFIELSVKSKGWIAGNEFLNSNTSCRFGIVSKFKTVK
ncbi:MAG: hypothetical protein ABI315_12985 [Bacteroidia bacterium]